MKYIYIYVEICIWLDLNISSSYNNSVDSKIALRNVLLC